MFQKKIELLSPVSNMESLRAAINFGADAVYLGTDAFGMRANAGNFKKNLLKEAVEVAHKNNVAVYLTFNTIPNNEDLKHLDECIKLSIESKVDAYIVADIGIFMELKRNVNDAKIHISTQAGVTNYKTAQSFYDLGAKRIVLARELNIDQIKMINDNTPEELEIETFVHGAICMAYSGRCLLSQYLTKRDANRGECSQPCRWNYHLMEKTRNNDYFPIIEDNKGTYILNSSDLCLIKHLDKLALANVSSFKIEGRAKSSYYVGVITNAYRLAIDLLYKNNTKYTLPKHILNEIETVSHRPYNTGFFLGEPVEPLNKHSGYIKKYEFLGIVLGYDSGLIEFKLKNKIVLDDLVEILEPQVNSYTIKINSLYDSNKNKINIANVASDIYYFQYDKNIKKGSFIRKKIS